MKKVLFISIAMLGLVACNSEEPTTINNNSNIESNESQNLKLKGEWIGTISGTPLEIIIELNEKSGTLSVPLQNIKELEALNVSYKDNQFKMNFNFNGEKIEITGTLDDQAIEGLFSQNGIEAPILFERYEEKVAEEETYEEIKIKVAEGTLVAALETPIQSTDTVAIIVAGSGGVDKNGNSPGLVNNSYKQLAESLANEGIATIRYDKRGIGENGGLLKDVKSLTIDDYVKDLESIVEYVRNEERFSKIHIIGHSEGALIGTLAAQNQTINSIILLAGAGRPIDEVLIEQLSAQLPDELLEESKGILNSLKKGQAVESVRDELQPIFSPSAQQYLISWIHYHPVEELGKLQTKKYIIQGDTDLQVTEKDRNALSTFASETITVDGMNHFLKAAPVERNANLATYNAPELDLHPQIVPIITGIIEGNG